jgi:hypothetical protein
LQAKGKKDRALPMGTKTIQMQRDHQKACTIKIWLFDGQQSGEQNSERRLQLVLRQALQ